MKTLTLSSKLKTLLWAGVAVGLVSFAMSYVMNPARAIHGYMFNYYYVFCLALGGTFFVGTQALTNAGWSSTVRRVPEAFVAWIPYAILLFIPIVLGGKLMYGWMDPAKVAADHNLQLKSAYLNLPFHLLRFGGLMAAWYFLGAKLTRNSLKQDTTGDVNLTKQSVKYAAIFMPFFALLFSLVSVDLLMSLDATWYSTMFGVNCFANLFLSALAVIIIFVISMKRAGYFGESVNENHTQNLGLLMFAFTVFYAYIAFCQFMLIWYGNLPEETSYFIRRWDNGWSFVALTILFVKFIIPFLLLLPREAKRNMNFLFKMACLAVVANWIDLFWMTMPAYSKTPFLPLPELGIFVGFLSAFALVVAAFLGRHPVQPQKDPRVHEALHLHQ